MTVALSLTESQKDVIQHVAVDLAVGLGWLLMSPNRTAGPGFAPARRLLHTSFYPMRAYGLLLCVLALMLVTSMVLHQGWLYSAARIALISTWAFWGATFVLSVSEGHTNLLGPVWGIAWTIRTVRLPLASPWART